MPLPKFLPSFGTQRSINIPNESSAAPSSSAPAPSQRKNIGGKGVIGGKEKSGTHGVGLGKGGLKRHRRLARRGGIKRISGQIYDEVREAIKDRIRTVGFQYATITHLLTITYRYCMIALPLYSTEIGKDLWSIWLTEAGCLRIEKS
ncbi:histone H4 [Lecanora helva]